MWNGPSTVAGVAPGSNRWFICTTSIESPSTSEARMNSSRFSSLIWPVRVQPLDRGHPLGLGQPHLAGEVVEVLHQRR